MGLETAAIVMAGISTAATVGKALAQTGAANSKEKSLELEGQQLQLQTQQKTLANYDLMERVLAAQTTHMTVTGTAFSSPSFNAIQRNTLNIGAKKGHNIEEEGEIAQENISLEKENVRNTLHAQLFGEAAGLASKGYDLYNETPRLEEYK